MFLAFNSIVDLLDASVTPNNVRLFVAVAVIVDLFLAVAVIVDLFLAVAVIVDLFLAYKAVC